MKKKKRIKSKRETYDLFHRKTAFQNECHAKELHIPWLFDNIIVSLLLGSSFFSTFSAEFFVWEFNFNHEQLYYETALVPLRRV